MISEYEAIKKILDSNHITDIDDIEYGGECFDELMDYFADEINQWIKMFSTRHSSSFTNISLCTTFFCLEGMVKRFPV